MATSGYIGIDGVARKIKAIYVGVNGIARKVKAAYVGVADLARKWFGGAGVKVAHAGSASAVDASIDSAGAVNGNLIFCGGDDRGFPANTTDMLYFLNYDTLVVTASSGGPEGVGITSATYRDGTKCVFAGGQYYRGSFLSREEGFFSSAYQYNTALAKTTLGNIAYETRGMAGVATQNHVLFGGGYVLDADDIAVGVSHLYAYSAGGTMSAFYHALDNFGAQTGKPLGNGAIFVASSSTTVSRYNAELVKQSTTNLPIALSAARAAEIEGNDTTGKALFGDSSRTYAFNATGVRTDLPAISGASGNAYTAAMGIVLDGVPLALFVFAGSAVSVDANLVVSEPQAGASLVLNGLLSRMQKDPVNKDKFVAYRSIYKAS